MKPEPQVFFYALIVALTELFLKLLLNVNLQPIKIFHDADQPNEPIRFPVHQMDGNPTV